MLWVALAARAQVSVLTYHNDTLRTGQNTQETVLTPSNVSSSVNSNQFGRLFFQSVDGTIVGQPLYMPNLLINGGTHNVIFVATENDSVYAFDADSNTGASANPLWHVSVIDTAHGAASGEKPADAGGGITSTPVIDPATNTMYVEAKSQLNSTYFHRLHALDAFTGNEKSPGPALISGSVPGTGGGGTTVNFSDTIKNQMNRPGLLLVNGTIYIGFASDGGDFSFGQYYGWVFAYDEATLAQKGVFNTTPNAVFNPPNPTHAGGGVWMSGAGLAADSAGNVFFATGNGLFDSNSDFADSILKVSLSGGSLSLTDYFTPFNQNTLDIEDLDLGSGGVLLLPDQTSSPQHLLVQVGKGDTSDSATVYVLNRDQLTTDNQHYCNGCSSDHVQQELTDAVGRMWGMPTYWNGKVYLWGTNDTLRAYTLSNSMLSKSPAFVSTDIYIHSANTSISANGTFNGIIWAAEAVDHPPRGTPGMILNAYDATNGNQLWRSSDNDGRDDAGGDVHFLVPTVANGKVYLGGTQLTVFGQNPPDFTLAVSPSSQGFPSGGGSQNYVITISSINNFNSPVTITLSNFPAPLSAFTSYACSPNPVNGGSGTSTCTVTVGGSAPTGTFTFNINGSGRGINHTITAQLCTSCLTLTLSPNSLLFLNQNVGTSSSPQTVTVSNNGTVAISSISASGDFAETNNCGSILAAGATCNIQVTFTPAVTGTQGGTLRVEDNATGSPQTVSLTGVASPVKDDALQISGTNCSNCQNQVTYFTIQQSPVYGYTIRPGDFLFFYQFQDGNSIGGITLCFAGSGSCDDDGKTVDQDGHPVNADTVQGMTHFRKVDLTPSVGLTVSQISFVSNGPAGPWKILYGAVQIFSADDAIHPIFITGDTPNIWVFGTTGVTQSAWTIVRNHRW